MRSIALTSVALLLACSSNGANRALPAAPAPADEAPELGANTAGSEGAVPRLTEDMAVPYFTGEASVRFGLRDWQAARDGFAQQLAEADDQQSTQASAIPRSIHRTDAQRRKAIKQAHDELGKAGI